jgi:hypothetical protein
MHQKGDGFGHPLFLLLRNHPINLARCLRLHLHFGLGGHQVDWPLLRVSGVHLHNRQGACAGTSSPWPEFGSTALR